MVSREGYEILEEGLQPCSPNGRVATDKTEIPGSFQENDDISDSISISGFWSESESKDEDCPWLTESCTAVLEPSKDESRDSVGNPKDLPEYFFTLSCPEIATDEESTRTSGKSTNHQDTQQSNSERHNSNEQQSRNKHHKKSNEQQSSSERHHSNEQQTSNEHHSSNEQQNSGEPHTSNEQQNSNEQHNSNEQQNRGENQNSNEQQNSSENHNSNEQQSNNEPHNSNEQQNDEQQNNSEQQNSSEHHPSNEQQNSNEQHNNNEQQNRGENYNINEQQSNSEHHSNNEEQTDGPHSNCCATFLDCYNVNSRKIKDSWFIYIFQLFVSLLSVSEIVMGIVFYGSCDPQPSPIPIIAILMGVSGLALVYNWLVKVRRHRRGEYYWNLERNILSVFLAIFLFLLILEVAFFTQASPKTFQSKVEVKCIEAYYDYLYCMFFAIGGSLVFAASLYLPDCCIYTFTYQAPVSTHTNGHYEPL